MSSYNDQKKAQHVIAIVKEPARILLMPYGRYEKRLCLNVHTNQFRTLVSWCLKHKGVNPCSNIGGIILWRNIHSACGMNCVAQSAPAF